MILIRNFRYRHPVSSQIINDWFQEIYSELVNYLGISNNKVTKRGIIKERMDTSESILTLENDVDNSLLAKYSHERYTRRHDA